MGIPVPPGPVDYGDDCEGCFPPGETPEICWLIVSGVGKGHGWLIGMPESVNGTFEMVQDAIVPCKWSYVGDATSYAYNTAGIVHPAYGCSLEIVIRPPFATDAFFGGQYFACKTTFENDLTEPPNKPFIGGTAMIFF